MRLAIVLFAALVVAAISIASCDIDHRSEQFACGSNSDCDPGRACIDGFCVLTGVPDASRGDAPPRDAGTNCPPGCTTCNVGQRTCTINCMTANCTQTVACPPGYNCTILCNLEGSCRNGINCQQSASCNVECTGRQSCEKISCGPGPCDVSCSGASSCRSVSCGSSCACDVTCSGNQSCQSGISCSSLACRSGSGCTSIPQFCHSCP